ncbi:MAG: hypothetical protein C4293_04640 [Nitrospiraceae bacterium]
MANQPQYGRRHFMKDSVISLVKTAQEFVKHRDAPTEKEQPASRNDWLRPPGAVAESLFLERCTRCGDCAKVCPYKSVKLDLREGLPIIFPDETPCHLCEDFPCIAACETDALLSVTDREQIRMGVAEISHRSCTADQGCNACVSKCPTGALSMDFNALRLVVSVQQCVGCGICEFTCKTVNDKIAIKVRPARFLTEDRR